MPIINMIMLSLKTPKDIISVPPKFLFQPTLENWAIFFGGVEANPIYGGVQVERILTVLLPNSVITACTSSLLTTGIALLSGYSLARFKFKGRSSIMGGILATRMLPPIATAIPLYIFMSRLGLRDTIFALIIAYVAINLPFAIWMLTSFIQQSPVEIEEAALVDGCTRIQALQKVIFPIVKPGIAATTIFNFVLSWNDFAIAFYLAPNRAATMPMYVLSFVTEAGTAWGPMACYGVIYILPAIIFTVIAQKHLVRGLTLGALKG